MEIPHVDITTGEIKGCEKGTFKWFHEEGHIKFNSEMSEYNLARETLFGMWMFLISFGIVLNSWFAYLSLVVWGIYFSMGVYEEYWCNMYAEKKIEREKHGFKEVI